MVGSAHRLSVDKDRLKRLVGGRAMRVKNRRAVPGAAVQTTFWRQRVGRTASPFPVSVYLGGLVAMSGLPV